MTGPAFVVTVSAGPLPWKRTASKDRSSSGSTPSRGGGPAARGGAEQLAECAEHDGPPVRGVGDGSESEGGARRTAAGGAPTAARHRDDRRPEGPVAASRTHEPGPPRRRDCAGGRPGHLRVGP